MEDKILQTAIEKAVEYEGEKRINSKTIAKELNLDLATVRTIMDHLVENLFLIKLDKGIYKLGKIEQKKEEKEPQMETIDDIYNEVKRILKEIEDKEYIVKNGTDKNTINMAHNDLCLLKEKLRRMNEVVQTKQKYADRLTKNARPKTIEEYLEGIKEIRNIIIEN